MKMDGLYLHDSILEYLAEVTVAPITLTISNIPSEVFPAKDDGMMRNCTINFDHIQTVSKDKIGALVTKLLLEKLKQVREATLFSLDL